MISNKLRIAIMSEDEVTTDIPEHADLNTAFPQTNWDTRARGLGATLTRPASTAAEENILCYNADTYRGESIFIHEFAHSIHSLGLKFSDSSFESKLTSAYNNAVNTGLWQNTYAISNQQEYWAEGVQSWFNANLESATANGIHNHVNTRQELLVHDESLYNLIAQVFPTDWRYECP